MAVLSTIFEAVDRMSDVFGSMADSGTQAITQFEQAGEAANAAFEQTSQAANEVARAMEASSQSTDYWTSAIGSYDKSAMEAVYSTEELVEMGYKSADALNEQNEMFALCEKSAAELSQSMNATIGIEENLSNAMKESAEISEQVANSDGISAEAKEELARASETAANALEELHRAQEEAAAAMDAYDATMTSGTNDLTELEAAAERAGHAAENLAEANGKATKATEELEDASEKASDELENAGNKGTKAFEELSSVLTAVGITATLKEMAEAAYELADAFSEAEKTVVLATGATDEALSGLEDSMMNAYAAAKSSDLSSTAGAIGEINTRLGLTGNELENVTGLFLDYANITNQDVVSSVGNVTKLMNQWGVELSNVEGLMDKLSYAGQISGINVGTLTDSLVTNRAILEQVGFTLDESIGLLAQAELQGISVQTVMMGLRTAITNFSDDGLDASVALREVIESIATLENESDATALAIDTFGSRAGAVLAGSIRGGQLSIDNLSSSLENASGTLEKTAEASQTLGEKWQQSSNKVKTAFTSAIEPAINKYSTALANATGKMGDFLNSHPKLTAGLTAIAVGLGTVTLGIVGVTTVVNVAIPAFVSFGTAVNAALGPVGWTVTAVVGVTAALVTLAATLDKTTNEYDNLTAASQKQYDEVERLSEAYENACQIYGETSYEAHALKGELEDARAEFEANKQTYEEFEASLHKTSEAMAELREDYNKNVEEIDKENSRVTALIGRLEELTTADDGTASSQAEILGIVKELNKEFPELNLNYEDVINNSSETIEALNNMALAEYNSAQAAKAWDTYVEAMGKVQEAKVKETAAEEQLAIAKEKVVKLRERDAELWAKDEAGELVDPVEIMELSDMTVAIFDAEMAVRQYEEALETANEETEKAQEEADGYAQKFAEASGITLETAETYDTLAGQIDNVAFEIQNLATQYQNAYEKALDSFSGQFGLFDTAKADAEATVFSMQNALDSQLNFWQTYADNVEVLKTKSYSDLGMTETAYNEIMAYAQSGTEEAAGFAQSLVNAINSGNTEAVAKLSDTLTQVKEARDRAAREVADWEIDFSNKMNNIVQTVETSMNDLDMSAEATAAATNTMNAYAQSVLTNGAKAVANAKSIAAQIKSALESAGANINISLTGGGTTGDGYASGTTNATPGFHLVGENGPEIIAFSGGETVYDADETEKILSAERPTPLHINAPESVDGQKTQNISKSEKRIILALEGGGEIKVPQGVDKETVMQLITSNLRPALLNIIQEEVFEEGDGTYAY